MSILAELLEEQKFLLPEPYTSSPEVRKYRRLQRPLLTIWVLLFFNVSIRKKLDRARPWEVLPRGASGLSQVSPPGDRRN